jgi:hypothetical protein
MAPLYRRISYSFGVALALVVICLIYIPQWRHFARDVQESGYPPTLTPWTVAFVTLLSLAMGLLASPMAQQRPTLVIVSRVLCALVICCSVVFLLEYATGIRFPDLDIFFLPDSARRRVSFYAARPSPESAATSLFFSSALLSYRTDLLWRKRLYQILLAAALVLPTIAAGRYIRALFLAGHALASLRTGLSPAAIALYFVLGSGMLRLAFGERLQKVPKADLSRKSVRPI